MGVYGDSGLPGPGSGPKCVRILLWATVLDLPLTRARSILFGQEERALLRARRQNGHPHRSVINVVMAPAGVYGGGVPGRCTQGGVPGPGSTRRA